MKNPEFFENYKKTVNSRNVILLVETGSNVLGLNSEKSDRDEMGVCVETLKDLSGFNTFEQDVYRTATDRTGKSDEPSKPGDIDLTIYGLRKFLKMALGGNPNLLNVLFTPESHCVITTPLGKELQGLADKIVSKQAGHAFIGYMRAQRARMQAKRNVAGVGNGYDVKHAVHLIRLAYQGMELLTTGKLSFPFHSSQLETLQGIRNGLVSYNSVIDTAASLEYDLDEALRNSNIRSLPDNEAIEKWMLNVYEQAWYTNENKTASQQQGTTPDTQRENQITSATNS